MFMVGLVVIYFSYRKHKQTNVVDLVFILSIICYNSSIFTTTVFTYITINV